MRCSSISSLDICLSCACRRQGAQFSSHQAWDIASPLEPRSVCLPPHSASLQTAHLSLGELVRTATVCKAWLAAAKKANIAPATLNNPTIGPASSLLRWPLVSSPFRRHVHAITHIAEDDATNRFHAKKKATWTIGRVAELGKLPQLRRISGLMIRTASAEQLKRAGTGCVVFSFPPLLESADMYFPRAQPLSSANSIGHGSSGSAELRCVLRALRPCHSLTELSLTLSVPDSSELVLDGLLEMASLQILTIDIQPARVGADRFTEAHIGVAKQLPNLRRLALLDCSTTWLAGNPPMTGWLRWLCALPHSLQQLEDLDLLHYNLRLEHMQLLQRPPSLTALEPSLMYDSALPLLPSFAARLRRLQIRARIADNEGVGPELLDFASGYVRAPVFLAHVTPCTALVHLTLWGCILSEADATTLCQALYQLRELNLLDVGWPSFESLRHLPQLESFSLQQFSISLKGSLQLLKAAHLAPLTRLRHLTLSRVLAQPLTRASSAAISALRPPSTLLPGLAEFHYSP